MAVGQRQRLYSGVRMFTGNYLSSPPQILREGGVQLELSTIYIYIYIIYIVPVPLIRVGPLGYFIHAALKKLLYIEPYRSSSEYFKPLLGPDDHFGSETATRRFKK
jgi:hypothetical protein